MASHPLGKFELCLGQQLANKTYRDAHEISSISLNAIDLGKIGKIT